MTTKKRFWKKVETVISHFTKEGFTFASSEGFCALCPNRAKRGRAICSTCAHAILGHQNLPPPNNPYEMSAYDQGQELGWDDAANCDCNGECQCNPEFYVLNDGQPINDAFRAGYDRGWEKRLSAS